VSFIDTERLVTMANQIGDFFAPYPHARRVEGVRNHLRNYWDPRMREALYAHIDATGGADLQQHVLEAAALVRADAAPSRAYAGPPAPSAEG
jgi:formate dehydrogenase subunit delta